VRFPSSTDVQLGACAIFLSTTRCTPEIATLSLHDALPISENGVDLVRPRFLQRRAGPVRRRTVDPVRAAAVELRKISAAARTGRSEEHTSELQSREKLVCRLLLEKNKEMEPPWTVDSHRHA